MNIQVNTTEKTIKLAETVNFKELVEVLDKLLPGEWKEYKLETNTIINNWSNPTIIYRDHYWPYYSNTSPYITLCNVGTGTVNDLPTFTLDSSGTYNLSIN